MSKKELIKIKKEKHASRCEVCHQSDYFIPSSNLCLRCNKLNTKISIQQASRTISAIGVIRTDLITNLIKNLSQRYETNPNKSKTLLIFFALGLSFGCLFQLIDVLSFPTTFWYKKGKAYQIPTATYHMIAASFLSIALVLGHYFSPILQGSLLRRITRNCIILSTLPLVALVACSVIRCNLDNLPTLIYFAMQNIMFGTSPYWEDSGDYFSKAPIILGTSLFLISPFTVGLDFKKLKLFSLMLIGCLLIPIFGILPFKILFGFSGLYILSHAWICSFYGYFLLQQID